MKTIVVGAGPVGTLAALYAAVRGDEVEVYELRDDLRDPNTVPLNFTKSINLALSERGLNALRALQHQVLLKSVLSESIPMRGRMIHYRGSSKSLKDEPQDYDVHGRCILAIDRAQLNKRLLDELEKYPNVKIFFQHKLTGADLNRNLAWFEQKRRVPGSNNELDDQSRAAEIEVSFDLMIGADGAHSAVRFHMMKFARVNYQQEYIDTLWCEFQMPPLPKANGSGFRLSPNHLHIWPAQESMFIAIPSPGHSFTCTLFLPAKDFQRLSKSRDGLERFFDEQFPGVIPDLISPPALLEQFSNNPHLPLISIKCSPHHFGSSCVIVGDAAHAMVPFYGQGMNAGFEDVRILYDILDTNMTSRSTAFRDDSDDSEYKGNDKKTTQIRQRTLALQEYTAQRTIDCHAINDLALQNYVEMRSAVRSTRYRARKWIEERLNFCFPALGWSTQYARVSFGNDRYSDIQNAAARQGRIIRNTLVVLFIAGTVAGFRLARRNLKK